MRTSVFQQKGLTLVEMLAVISMLGILAAVALPSLSGSGMSIATGGHLIVDQLRYARQTAVTRNKPVEVRFIEDARESGYTAIQVWEYDSSGDNPKPLRRVEKLSDSIIVRKETSPALQQADATLKGTTNFGVMGSRPYVSLRFKPNGRLESGLPMAKSYLTVSGRRDDAAQPSNYYTVQVSPLTGRVASHQP